MINETQNTIQEAGRDTQGAPSRLETLAYRAVGVACGSVLTGAFLYDPVIAAVTAVNAVAGTVAGTAVGAGAGAVFDVAGAVFGVATGVGLAVAFGVATGATGVATGVAGVAAGVASLYLLNRTRAIQKRLKNLLGTSALIASLGTGAGYGISSYVHRISAVRQFKAGEEQGIMIETPRDNKIYLLRDATNYVSLDKAREDALRSVTSYAEKELEIKKHYDGISRALSVTKTNALTTNTLAPKQ